MNPWKHQTKMTNSHGNKWVSVGKPQKSRLRDPPIRKWNRSGHDSCGQLNPTFSMGTSNGVNKTNGELSLSSSVEWAHQCWCQLLLFGCYQEMLIFSMVCNIMQPLNLLKLKFSRQAEDGDEPKVALFRHVGWGPSSNDWNIVCWTYIPNNGRWKIYTWRKSHWLHIWHWKWCCCCNVESTKTGTPKLHHVRFSCLQDQTCWTTLKFPTSRYM